MLKVLLLLTFVSVTLTGSILANANTEEVRKLCEIRKKKYDDCLIGGHDSGSYGCLPKYDTPLGESFDQTKCGGIERYIFNTKLRDCGYVCKKTGATWITVASFYDMPMDWTLNTTPIEILTSTTDLQDKVYISFKSSYTEGDDPWVTLSWSMEGEVAMPECFAESETMTKANIADTDTRTWRIEKSRTGLTVFCNNEEVYGKVFQTCTSTAGGSKKLWAAETTQMKVSQGLDTATDYYRAYQKGT